MSAILDEKVFGNCHLYLGDCYQILKELDENSIDLIHTDPPYVITSNQNLKIY